MRRLAVEYHCRGDVTMSTPATHRLEELSVDQCLTLLGSGALGRLVFLRNGEPDVRPLTYDVHQGSVIFRIGYGDLLDAIHGHDVVFEVDSGDPAVRTGWSVIVRGKAEEIWRTDDLERVRETGLRPWAPGTRDHYVRIIPTSITGRRIA
jgi:nitroimidazol reductase NimA-like FMN-containing flavoprotein (pyridoxamine 5'-phosphate oxidase superfamily)